MPKKRNPAMRAALDAAIRAQQSEGKKRNFQNFKEFFAYRKENPYTIFFTLGKDHMVSEEDLPDLATAANYINFLRDRNRMYKEEIVHLRKRSDRQEMKELLKNLVKEGPRDA